VHRYCSRVSAADGIVAPFTSQTSPVYPTVVLLLYDYSRLHTDRLVFADCDVEVFTFKLPS